MKRRIITLGCLAITLCLAACSGAPAATTGATTAPPDTQAAATTTAVTTTTAAEGPEFIDASWQRDTSPVRLTINDGLGTTVRNEKYREYGADDVSRRIMDLTGVTLVMKPDYTPLEVLQASGEMTDLVWAMEEENIARLRDGSLSWALDELAEQYCPDFWDRVDDMDLLANRSDDGHVYTLRTSNNTAVTYQDPAIPLTPPYTMTFRQDILDRAGEEMPTSIEALEALLYRMKDREQELGFSIPLRLADAAETPLAGWMGLWQTPYWDGEAAKVRTPWRQEEWLGYLKMIRRWVADGVAEMPLPPDPSEADYGEKLYTYRELYYERTQDQWLVTAEYNRLMYNTYSYHFRNGAGAQESPFPYVLVEEPMTYGGEVCYRASEQTHGEWSSLYRLYGGLFIAKTCSNPERAMLFLQFLNSDEGVRLTHWGIEGTHYTQEEDGTLVYLPEYQNQENDADDGISVSKRDKTGITRWTYLGDGWAEGVWAASPKLFGVNSDYIAYKEMLIRAGLSYKSYAAQNWNPALMEALPSDATPDLQEQYDELYRAFRTAAREAVYADSNAALEARWSELMAELNTGGIDALEEQLTTRFTDALGKYQAEGYLTEIKASE